MIHWALVEPLRQQGVRLAFLPSLPAGPRQATAIYLDDQGELALLPRGPHMEERWAIVRTAVELEHGRIRPIHPRVPGCPEGLHPGPSQGVVIDGDQANRRLQPRAM